MSMRKAQIINDVDGAEYWLLDQCLASSNIDASNDNATESPDVQQMADYTIWHVISRSGEVISTALKLYLYT